MRPGDSYLHKERLAEAYLGIRDYVIQAGYAWEIDWQDTRSLAQLTEQDFLAESAWVILSSGMRETVVRNRFEAVSRAFKNWTSAHTIAASRAKCEKEAREVFNHPAKIRAIGDLCERVATCTFPQILKQIEASGIDFLQTFEFIGPVTRFHLAKNIGLDVVKPDRHLLRMAAATGCSHPNELCRHIAEVTGDKVSVIDLVLWRYAVLEGVTETVFDATVAPLSSRR